MLLVDDAIVQGEEGIGAGRGQPDVAIGDGAMIALKHQGPERLLVVEGAGSGGPGHLDILMD